MPPRNQISAAAGIPKSVPEPFSTRRARSTGSIATQYQSDLELLEVDAIAFLLHHAAEMRPDMVFLAHPLLGPVDRRLVIAGKGFHPAMVVGGSPTQHLL